LIPAYRSAPNVRHKRNQGKQELFRLLMTGKVIEMSKKERKSPRSQGPGAEGCQDGEGGIREGFGGYCVCPKCGLRVSRQLGIPCYAQRCPRCGTAMTRDQSLS